MTAEPYSLYVHIPFCRTRCTYCAFNTYAGLEAQIEPYVAALEREIEYVAGSTAAAVSHTLYFGGGTPSLLAPDQVSAVIRACQKHLGLAHDAEITLEANPGSVDQAGLDALRASGVNRLSVGVDLIYGAPGQSRQSWRASLDAVLAWEPDSVSLYSLTLEAGTSLQRRVERGRLPHPDPDLAADMYEDAQHRLERAGFRQVEISNWARPGHECLHNRQYWLNRPYLGFGAGAHGAACGLRYWNVDPIPRYLERLSDPSARPARFPLSPAVAGFEVIDRQLAMSETMILGLRLVADGVSRSDFARRFGRSLESVFGPTIEQLAQAGLLASEGDRLRLTARAYLVSNRVFAHFLT